MVKPLPDTVNAIVQRLAERYQPERIILFGSHATGQPHADSDIDLLIVKQTTKPFHQRLTEVRQVVSDVRRGCPFEPIVVTPEELQERLQCGDQFLGDIVKHGMPLYG